MNKPFFNVAAIREIQERRMAKAMRKNNDYAAQGDNIALTGAHGLAVRLLDKAMRLYNLTMPGQVQQVKDESITDTFLDVGNYGDFGVSVIEGTWGVRPPEPQQVTDLREWIKGAGDMSGATPDRIRFDGLEVTIKDLWEFFIRKGQPVGTAMADEMLGHCRSTHQPTLVDKAKEWGGKFESIAHRHPPAGVDKTVWLEKNTGKRRQPRSISEIASTRDMLDATTKKAIQKILQALKDSILTNHNRKVKERADARAAKASKRKRTNK